MYLALKRLFFLNHSLLSNKTKDAFRVYIYTLSKKEKANKAKDYFNPRSTVSFFKNYLL
jgi:hypothetical protein